jgi:hypothetical protein
MSMKQDLADLRKFAEKHGWIVEETNSGHLRWVPPDGGPVAFSPKTPSDYRGVRNFRAQLRRRGLPREDGHVVSRRTAKKQEEQPTPAPAPKRRAERPLKAVQGPQREPKFPGAKAIAKCVHEFGEEISTREILTLLGSDPTHTRIYASTSTALRRMEKRGEIEQVGKARWHTLRAKPGPAPEPEPKRAPEPAPEPEPAAEATWRALKTADDGRVLVTDGTDYYIARRLL